MVPELIIALQPAHAYVMLVGAFGCLVALWAGMGVGQARKKYGVKYPTMYLEASNKNATAFNCYQRAHQNVLENLPNFLFLLLTASIFRPEAAAIVGLVRVLGFIIYVKGYQSGEPKNRLPGQFGFFAFIGLVGLSIEAAVKLIRT